MAPKPGVTKKSTHGPEFCCYSVPSCEPVVCVEHNTRLTLHDYGSTQERPTGMLRRCGDKAGNSLAVSPHDVWRPNWQSCEVLQIPGSTWHGRCFARVTLHAAHPHKRISIPVCADNSTTSSSCLLFPGSDMNRDQTRSTQQQTHSREQHNRLVRPKPVPCIIT